MAKRNKKSKPLWFIALVLAWLIPGAGHYYVGQKIRGIILMVTIAALFWAGVAMGGVMTVDSHYESWWFAAQSITGIHGLIGWYRQEQVYKSLSSDLESRTENANRPGRPGREQMTMDHQLQQRGLVLATPTGSIVRAYTGVAGMLNLMCIFDAVMLCFLGFGGKPNREKKIAADLKEKDGKNK